jgi:hypothetical protein
VTKQMYWITKKGRKESKVMSCRSIWTISNFNGDILQGKIIRTYVHRYKYHLMIKRNIAIQPKVMVYIPFECCEHVVNYIKSLSEVFMIISVKARLNLFLTKLVTFVCLYGLSYYIQVFSYSVNLDAKN